MSGDTWLVSGTNVTNGSGSPAPGFFWPLIQSAMNSYTTELNSQSKTVAGVMDKCLMDVENTTAGVTVMGVRLNGTNTALGASQTSGTTGKFEDLTHTATSVANDLLNFTGFSATSSVQLGAVAGVHFVATTSEAILSGAQGQNNWAFGGSGSAFSKLCGGYEFNAATSTEANAQFKQRAVGTWTHLFTMIFTNGTAGTVVAVIRKNGANGNNTISFSAAATGNFQDTTHSDTIASGDLTCIGWSDAGAASAVPTQAIAVFNPANHQWDAGSNTSGVTGSSGNTIFQVLAGQNPASGQLIEANAQYLFRFGTTAQNLRTNVIGNAGTACTENYRANGANGNQSASITASTTGYFEDATHHDTIVSGDLGCTSRTSSTGANINELPHITMGTGVSGETGAIAMSFGGISMAITATNQDATHIAMSFQGITIAIAATALATFRGPIAMTFPGISMAINAQELGASGSGRRQFWTF